MNVTVKDLLDAGVHFGHQLRRWNPKTKPFVFDNRHGISIIDLEKTYDLLESAANAMEGIVASGKKVLLVGTKRQAQEPIREMAASTNMLYCVSRWLGGTLTNYQTVSTSIAKYKKFLRMEEDGTMDQLPGKEAAAIKRQMARMSRNFEGLLDMNELPGALFVIDSRTEAIAVAEANRLEIPVCALVDSNSDPTLIDYPIPGNDDSSKSIRIVADVIMEAIQSGSANRVVVKVQKGITPVVQDDFDDGDDEPEVNLPEGYEEFVDTRRREDDSEETEGSTEDAPAEEAPAAEEETTAEDEEVTAETDQEELKEQEAEAGEETPEEEEASNDDSDSASEEKPEN